MGHKICLRRGLSCRGDQETLCCVEWNTRWGPHSQSQNCLVMWLSRPLFQIADMGYHKRAASGLLFPRLYFLYFYNHEWGKGFVGDCLVIGKSSQVGPHSLLHFLQQTMSSQSWSGPSRKAEWRGRWKGKRGDVWQGLSCQWRYNCASTPSYTVSMSCSNSRQEMQKKRPWTLELVSCSSNYFVVLLLFVNGSFWRNITWTQLFSCHCLQYQ